MSCPVNSSFPTPISMARSRSCPLRMVSFPVPVLTLARVFAFRLPISTAPAPRSRSRVSALRVSMSTFPAPVSKETSAKTKPSGMVRITVTLSPERLTATFFSEIFRVPSSSLTVRFL